MSVNNMTEGVSSARFLAAPSRNQWCNKEQEIGGLKTID